MIIFDIETEPRPEEEIINLCPEFDASKFEPSEFDPAAVKLGNIKDEAKRAAKIQSAMKAHEAEQSTLKEDEAKAREKHISDFVGKASLSASTGRVLAIGYFNGPKDVFAYDLVGRNRSEKDLISDFWAKACQKFDEQTQMAGVNIHGFDLPFLVRRSWVLGVEVPRHMIVDLTSKWPRFNVGFVDLGKVWLLGQHPGQTKWNFNYLAAAFGSTGKPGGEVDGASFWKAIRNGDQTSRDAALHYLESDCRQPYEWAKRMGLIEA